MFNNIIYFIIVLLVFSLKFPEETPESPLFFSLGMLFLCWVLFAFYCRTTFGKRHERPKDVFAEEGFFAGQYQRIVTKLSVVAILFFTLAVYGFHLKDWLRKIPGLSAFETIQTLFGLALFFIYLCTVWYFAFPSYRAIFQPELKRRSFVVSNCKFNVPILFPWLTLSLVYDLMGVGPWSDLAAVLDHFWGQLIFFTLFMVLLMIFLPRLITYWWGCKPIEGSEKGPDLVKFLDQHDFKYRSLLQWPIFEGKVMTAGIMGVISRYRYILVTESLMQILSLDELKAVLSHEIGHAKYRHILFYVLFLIGFMVLSAGLFDLFFYLLAAHPFFIDFITLESGRQTNIFYLFLSVPILLTLLIYFRFVMGYFMRNFERQADLYSAEMMGTPEHTISSLEKIALFSGKIRDLPNWHHFSIRQRVDCLKKTVTEPDILKKHNRFITGAFVIYFVLTFGLGYALNTAPVKERAAANLIEKALKAQILAEPADPMLYVSLAMLYHETEKYAEAEGAYEKAISLDPDQAAALNNLAWLLLTEFPEEIGNESRALVLAKRAVALERSPVYLDTLAEAYFRNGFVPEAIDVSREALTQAKGDRQYYEEQLARFSSQH